jgi:hypothetical protein
MVPTARHLLALGVRAAPGNDIDVDLHWADDGPFARTGSRAVP